MKFTIKPVFIPVKKQKMRGTLYIPDSIEKKLPSVVVLHGRGSSQARYTDRAEALAEAGFLTLIFSFRGCGESDGDFAEQTIKMGHEDAIAGYDFLLQQDKVDKNRVGVYGGSYGGYHASLLTQHRSVNSLILSVPALYLNSEWELVPETMKDEHQKYRNGDDFSDSIAIKAIAKYEGPLLLVPHELDDICPAKQTDAFFDHAVLASKKEKIVIDGVGHPLIEKKDREKSNKITVAWFKETL